MTPLTALARRSAPPPSALLLAEARAALAAVISDMRNVPRAIIGDPAEVVHFLGRQARRLAGIRDMRAPTPAPPALKPPSAVLMAPAGAAAALTAAETTFSTPARKSAMPPSISFSSGTISAPPPALRSREVRNRDGRTIPVRLRRAPGQLDLPL